jgi:5-methylcytosine-specific restriction protein B
VSNTEPAAREADQAVSEESLSGTVWGIHNDVIPAETLLAEGFVSIGWRRLGDLTEIGDDQQAMKKLLLERLPNIKEGAIPTTAGMLRRFAFGMEPGDLVVAPNRETGNTYNIGMVTGPYRYDASLGEHPHRREVKWLVREAPRAGFSQTARYELGSAMTLFRVANHGDEFVRAVVDGPPAVEDDQGNSDETRYGLLQRTVLEILTDKSPQPRRKVLAAIPERIELTPHELEVTGKAKRPRYRAAITWGSVDMVAAGWLERTSGGWAITDEGRSVLETMDPGEDLAKLSSKAYRAERAKERRLKGRFKAVSYRVIDQAVKLLDEGQWTTYSDIAAVAGSNPSSVGEYVHEMGLDGHHRVTGIDGVPYEEAWRAELEAEGVTFGPAGSADPRQRITAEDLREQLDELGHLPKVSRRAWLVRGGRAGHRTDVQAWLHNSEVALMVSNLSEMDAGASRDEVKAAVDEDYSHLSYSARGELVDALHCFLTRMERDDVLVAMDEGRLHLGRITGDPEFRTDVDTCLVRSAEWFGAAGVDQQDVPSEVVNKLKVQRDVVDLTQFVDKLEGLLEAEATGTAPPTSATVELRSPTPDLAQALHVEQAWLQEVIDLLNDRPQLIFYGPPGTGKTFLAQRIAQFAGGDNVELVQFHAAYSYEDFMEGFRPTEDGAFKLKPGPMRKVVDKATDDPTTPYFLIIDEINRGNLAKVFGELYFLLEYRDENVTLLYSDEPFVLPKNVYIIGTMNTADRSIALVDAAMRRRFAFLPLHPAEEPTDDLLRRWLVAEGFSTRVADLHEELNRRIEDADFKIGPSYFMRHKLHEDDGTSIRRVWRTSILPLLEEHHFGELAAAEVKARYSYDSIATAVDRGAAVDTVPDEVGVDDAISGTD